MHLLENAGYGLYGFRHFGAVFPAGLRLVGLTATATASQLGNGTESNK